METVDMNLNRFARGLTENLEPSVRKHLKNVYASFTAACVSACVGGYADMFSSLIGAGLMTGLGALGMLLWLFFTPYDGKNQKQRIAMLCAFAFFSGVNLGPLLQIAAVVDETLIFQALLGASIVFASFSLAALYADRGHFLYLGGFLMSTLSTLMWLSILNIFFGSRLIFQASLYIGLLVMCGFVVYDTQAIIEKNRRGDKDYVMHSVDLFIDFISIFKKLLIILTDKEANARRRKKN